MNKLFQELKRRNVFKVATAYAIAGWLIIQIIVAIEKPLSLPDWLDTTVIILVGIGFPIALIIAWAFELTPDGLKKTDSVESTDTINTFKASKSKKLNKIIISVLSLAIIFLIVERLYFANNTSSSDLDIGSTSIAVLPFADLSPQGDQEYFSDGLSEELLNILAKVEDMKVAGRTSSFKFKGQNENLTLIGNELNVNHILEGSVRKSGNRIRITAQLIKVEDGFHLWSETYDRELTANNVFDIQEEISRTVLNELKVRLLPQEETEIKSFPTKNLEAYNAYLKGTQLVANRRPEDIQQAIEHYKNAIALDKDFGLAYSRLALAYGFLIEYGGPSIEETTINMKQNVDKALQFNNNLGVAYRALGYYKQLDIIPNSDEEALKAFQKGLEYEPNNAYIYNHIVHIYQEYDGEKAYQYILKAHELDPLSDVISSNLADFHIGNEKYEEGLGVLDDLIKRSPKFANAHNNKAELLRSKPYGDLVGSFKTIYNAYKKDSLNRILLNGLTRAFIDLDMIPAADYYLNISMTHYRESLNTIGLFVNINSIKGNAAINIQLLEGFKERFGEVSNRPISDVLSYMYLISGNSDKAKTIIEDTFPDIVNPDYQPSRNSFEDQNDINQIGVLLKYAVIADLEGNTSLKQNIASKLCSLFDTLKPGSIMSAAYNTKEDHEMICAALQGNAETFANTLRNIYFEKNHKYLWKQQQIESYYLLYKDTPEVKAYEKEVLDDVHKARAEVITYLKTQGDWKSEWEVE
ncbi:hypothetical protein D7030_12475 [Flavobacteriaceae bacterium AU392]|nr:hypothetical protein D1817_06015 [Flavobacteriaceae bacterium]RKM81130.1 hypothetical protein D7030_12475 [Flavobacteriaceae bacterium AU392]